MPNPLAITLHASAAETVAGTGAETDVGLRTYTEIQLDVTAITGTLSVTVESSPTLSSWTPVGYFNSVTAQGARTLTVPDGNRYLRARWQATSATFSVTGKAHQLYVLPKDIAALAPGRNLLDTLGLADLAKACLTASSEAEGYLASAATLPIVALDDATKTHIARLALFEVFRFRGIAVGSQESIEIARSDALTWLNRIATGKLRPPGLVDATPDTPEVGSPFDLYVVSQPSRGW